MPRSGQKSTTLRLGLLGGAAVSLCGCAMVTPESRMAEVATKAPVRWVATREARAGVDREWIARFGDRTLEALVREGLANNHDLRLAGERVREAGARARVAGSSLRPSATATLDGTRRKQQFFGFPGGGGNSTTSTYGTSLDVTWEVDLWGRVRAAQSAEVGEWQAQGFDYRAAQTSFAAQMAKAWFSLTEANEQIVLAQAALEIRKKTAQAIEDRFDLALEGEGGTAAQLRLARSDEESARATLAQWKGERERALRELELLVGRYPAGSNLSTRGLPAIPKRPPAGLPSGLLLRRPDVLASERRYASAGKRTREAELAVFPNLTLTGSLGTSTDSLSNLLDSDLGVWSIGADLLQPVLTGGRLRYEMIERRSREHQQLIELQKTVLDAFGEVEQALVADAFLARRVEATAEAARHAREAAEAAGKDFEGGTGDVLTLLESESRKITTATQLVTLRRTQLDNRVNLHLALGGDFQVRGK